MKVSVVIPAFNEEKYIANSLNSLKQQIEQPDEIIMVDNLSIDNTVKIARGFNIKIIEERTKGIGHARNLGFNAASSNLIARCDADTVVPPDWIKKIKQNFTRKIDALVGPVLFYDILFNNSLSSKLFIYFMKLLQGHYPLFGLNMAITRNMWLKVKDNVCIDDRKVHDDIDLAMHVHKEHGVIGYDSTLIVKSSGRRIEHNIFSFFVEYPIRLIKTVSHKID